MTPNAPPLALTAQEAVARLVALEAENARVIQLTQARETARHALLDWWEGRGAISPDMPEWGIHDTLTQTYEDAQRALMIYLCILTDLPSEGII